MDIKLKLITNDDLSWARVLRNKNRAYFFSNSLITKKTHDAWFNSLDKNLDFYIIWFGNKRIGTISAENIGKRIKLGNIILDEKYRGKGILDKVMELLEQIYLLPFELEVKADNEAAIKAYTKIGFKPYGIRMRL